MNKTIYKQLDSRWSSKPYPTYASSFGGNGCGCCACVHIAIEQDRYKKWTPESLRPWMVKQGFAYPHQGTTWQGITATLKHLGHKDVVCVWNDPMSSAWKELNKGNRIGVLLVSNGRTPDGTYWTSSGHYVAFTDYMVKDGKHWFYIKDSGGRGHDGWYCYEKSIKGALPKLWIVERLDASKQKEKPEPVTAAASTKTASKAPYKVIDVSEWQGKIDWKKVKADGVVGAIIRYADGDYVDKYFAANMKGAKAEGIHVGAYIFSRAKTEAQAKKEAKRLYNACKPYEPDMPLYIDLEAKGLEKYADTAAQAFLAKMKELGGRGGVYANVSWWNNYLRKTVKGSFAMWVAQYYKECQYKPITDVGMWQYSSSGKVKGISGNVDMNKCYVAYWKK